MARWRIRPSSVPLRGAVIPPADGDIARMAVLLGALADGTSTLSGRFGATDVAALCTTLDALGIESHTAGETVTVRGRGIDGLREPHAPLDARSAASLRLLSGLLAGRAFDATIRCAEPARIASLMRPLRSRGARIDGVFDAAHNDEEPPVVTRAITDGAHLGPLEHALAIEEVHAKGALLLSGLTARGPTALTEPLVTPDHAERLLDAMGAPIQTMASAVLLDPEGWTGKLAPLEIRVAGDAACATMVVVAAHAVRASHVVVRGVSVNPTRAGGLEVLRHMGARVIVEARGASGGEPLGDLHVGAFEPPRVRAPAHVCGELAMRARDGVAALAVAAALLPGGTSTFEDLPSDELARLNVLMRSFSIDADVVGNVLRVRGGARITGRDAISTGRDPWIALAAATLALAADGPSVIDDVACAADRFPDFVAVMRHLGANIVEES